MGLFSAVKKNRLIKIYTSQSTEERSVIKVNIKESTG